ncbi:MAG: hypothetical protein ACYCYN_03040 [Solirubrobacteraceae bacterium]
MDSKRTPLSSAIAGAIDDEIKLADQAKRKIDEATLWLVKNDPVLRAAINEKRAAQGYPPLDANSIARAAKNRVGRQRKRARAPIGPDRPKGEGDRELKALGNFGGWPSATAFGSKLLSADDPEQAALALETLREYVIERLAAMARGCGGRPRGDVGKAELQKMRHALALTLGGDAEKLRAVMKLLECEGEAKAKAKATGTGKGGAT